MAWVRLDEEFPDHPKIVSAGPLAAWLYVAGLCYCNRLLTNGFIPEDQISRLIAVPEASPFWKNSRQFRKKAARNQVNLPKDLGNTLQTPTPPPPSNQGP